MNDSTEDGEPEDSRPVTLPDGVPIAVTGFEDRDVATAVANTVGAAVRIFSKTIDLSTLCRVTVAVDYKEALRSLDRGFQATSELTPSEGFSVGVAMAVPVIQQGTVKSHLVFNAAYVAPIVHHENEFWAGAVHVIAHECAHVEITAAFDKAFPGEMLVTKYPTYHAALRWQISQGCWDEYAATWISARLGQPQTEGYEENFLHWLAKAQEEANEKIIAYRYHGDNRQITDEVYAIYGSLMKYACYHIGNMRGLALTLDDLPATKAALDGHWFEPYFHQLKTACDALAKDFGRWPDKSGFEALGDIADEIVSEGRVEVTAYEDGSMHIDVPYTMQTLPEEGRDIVRQAYLNGS